MDDAAGFRERFGGVRRALRQVLVASWSHARCSISESDGQLRSVFEAKTCPKRLGARADSSGRAGRDVLQWLLYTTHERGRPMTHDRPGAGFRMTARDLEIVRWVGRLRMASASQIAERFGLGRAVGYARLSGLVNLGLLEHARIFHAAPGVYLGTRAGLAAVDVEKSLANTANC